MSYRPPELTYSTAAGEKTRPFDHKLATEIGSERRGSSSRLVSPERSSLSLLHLTEFVEAADRYRPEPDRSYLAHTRRCILIAPRQPFVPEEHPQTPHRAPEQRCRSANVKWARSSLKPRRPKRRKRLSSRTASREHSPPHLLTSSSCQH